jgi:cytochrome c556
MRKWTIAMAAAGLAWAGWQGASGADSLVAVVKQRQHTMRQMGQALKPIKAYAGGHGDQAAASRAADDLIRLASIVPTVFPPGTSRQDLPGRTAAKLKIWQNPDDFQALEVALNTNAATLQKVIAAGDRAATLAAFQALGKNACSACHQTYRGAQH